MFCYDFLGTSIVASISAYHVVDRGSTTAPTSHPPQRVYIFFLTFKTAFLRGNAKAMNEYSLKRLY